MNYVFLIRGSGSNEMLIWLLVIALLITLLGGRWLIQRTIDFIRHRRIEHLWPFR